MKRRDITGLIIAGAVAGVPMAVLGVITLVKNPPAELGDKYTDLVQRAWLRIKTKRKATER